MESSFRKQLEEDIMERDTALREYFLKHKNELMQSNRAWMVKKLRGFRLNEECGDQEAKAAMQYLPLVFPEVPEEVLERAFQINQKRLLETMDMIRSWVQNLRPSRMKWGPDSLSIPKTKYLLLKSPRQKKIQAKSRSSEGELIGVDNLDWIIELQIAWVAKLFDERNTKQEKIDQLETKFRAEDEAYAMAKAIVEKTRDQIEHETRQRLISEILREVAPTIAFWATGKVATNVHEKELSKANFLINLEKSLRYRQLRADRAQKNAAASAREVKGTKEHQDEDEVEIEEDEKEEEEDEE